MKAMEKQLEINKKVPEESWIMIIYLIITNP